ncbi:lariat debranching enzyme, C-terminal domain-containing protein [Xylariomycetidae sp. FL0641]|nr:lariat debranching enzyme, C-terminal domain-containing protein [Xylariomycetidae sp. FL0641]
MEREMESGMYESDGVRIAVEGCGHGTLDAIYASVGRSAQARGWDGVDLLIIGGDFQAARNAADLTVMSVPPKYRALGDFPAYYKGTKTAPYLTLFIAGNHEASAYLWELYYGGWVAPNMYYLGAANVLRLGPLRLAGLSGIWKGFDYRKPHLERLPFNRDDVKSFYHVREIDVRKLLLVREQVDVGLSHDWPRNIEHHGNANKLWQMKPDFKQDSRDGKLGSPAAEYVMDRLRPAYWFSAHLHCKFAAVKNYDAPDNASGDKDSKPVAEATEAETETAPPAGNPDEIDLDEDEDGDVGIVDTPSDVHPKPANNLPPKPPTSETQASSAVPEDVRALLPASFAAPAPQAPKQNPGQPVPASITNKTTRFLALDKCLPGRKFIQLLPIAPLDTSLLSTYPPNSSSATPPSRFELQYDPEWLAIQRALAPQLSIGDPSAPPSSAPPNADEHYAPALAEARAWVDEHVVRAGKLRVPQNFTQTARPHTPQIDPETVDEQPDEHTNPQTAAFCELLGVPNLWDASPEERAERMRQGPRPDEFRPEGARGRGGRGGRGRGRGRGGGGRGGRGRGLRYAGGYGAV